MSESKPCGCRVVWACDGRYTEIEYCPSHKATPIGLKLAEAVLAWLDNEPDERGTAETQILDLARRVVETAEPKEER